MTTRNDEHREEPPGELISGVLSDARDLAVAEVDRLKAEAKGVGQEVKVASVGILILTVGAAMLAVAIALGLVALGLPGWAGFGVVAIALGACGGIVLERRKAIAGTT